jgi:hypothetical protein
MRTALVISRDNASKTAWGSALERAGWTVVHAPDVAIAFSPRARDVDLLVVDAESDDQLDLLARLCVSCELPPIVVRTSRLTARDLVSWGTIASIHVDSLSPPSLVCAAEAIWSLGPASASSLPLRLPILSLSKWTVRVRAAA